jgi:Bor protein
VARTLRLLTLLLGLVASTTACHTMRFDVGSGPVSEVVYERKSFFLGGIGPTRKVDVRVHCPNGAVAIREQTTFVDGLFNLITLGIWAPRSSWYYCAAKEA